MIHIPYIFLILFCSIFLEIFFGNFGIIVPFIAISIFYLSTIFNTNTGIIIAIIAGGIIDILYGRYYCITPITLSLVALLALFWQKKGDLKNILLQFIPGATLSLIYAIPILTIKYWIYEKGILALFINILILILAIILGAILLPGLILLLDYINKSLKLNTYIIKPPKL